MGNFFALLCQPQCRFTADESAADYDDLIGGVLFSEQYFIGSIYRKFTVYGHLFRCGSTCTYDDVCLEGFCGIRGDFGIEVYLYTLKLHLAFVIVHKFQVITFEVWYTAWDQVAAKVIALLTKDNVMTTQCTDSSCFHAGNTATGYKNLLFLECRSEPVNIFSAACRIDCAGYGRICNTSHTSLMAAETWSDLVNSSLFDLCGNLCVSEKRASVADNITTGTDGFFCQFRIVHTTCQNDRNIYFLFQNATKFTVHAVLEIHWRMVPVPGVISSGVDIERIISGVNENLGCRYTLLDIFADFRVVLARKTPSNPAFFAIAADWMNF